MTKASSFLSRRKNEQMTPARRLTQSNGAHRLAGTIVGDKRNRRGLIAMCSAVLSLSVNCNDGPSSVERSVSEEERAKTERRASELVRDWRAAGRPMSYELVPRLEYLGEGAKSSLDALLGDVDQILRGLSVAPPVSPLLLDVGEDPYEARLAVIEDYRHLRREAVNAIKRLEIARSARSAKIGKDGRKTVDLAFSNGTERSVVFRLVDEKGRVVAELPEARPHSGWGGFSTGLTVGKVYRGVGVYSLDGAVHSDDLGTYTCSERDKKVQFHNDSWRPSPEVQ